MKLTLLFLTAGFLNVYAKGISQNITFSGQNVPLETAFASVEKQTGFVFMYAKPVLNTSKPVSVSAENVPLEQFLFEIFKSQPLEYTIKGKSIFISAKVPSIPFVDQQFVDIRGRVINNNGEPLSGANIKVNGTNLGASTDGNGYYKIENIPPGEYTIVASFVGYGIRTAHIKLVENKTGEINFILTPSLVNLDEMTVTSTLSKRLVRSYPGTIAEIKGKDLENRNLNNIANVLEAIPGVIITPGSEFTNSANARMPSGVLIRGTSAGAQIKYLVDGVEIVTEGENVSILQTIDPYNIEKIEILKGPMASTLYGNGAAGGIISITTKKGKQGKGYINFKTMYTQYANDYAKYNGYNQNYSLNVSGGSEQFNYLLGVGYNLYPLTKLTDLNNGIDTKTKSYNAKFGGKLRNITTDISLQYGNENSGIGSTVISDNKYRASLGLNTYPIYPISDWRRSQRSSLTSLHIAHTITNNWYHDLTIGYNTMNYNSFNHTQQYDGTYPAYDYSYLKINARYFMFYDHTWSTVLKTSITAGFEYNAYKIGYLSFNSTKPITNFSTGYTPAIEGAAYYGNAIYSSTGYFAEAVTGFKNALFLTTGIRYDVNPAYGDNVGAYPQPRVGLSYVIESDKFKIKPRIVWGVSSTPPDPAYKTTSTDLYTGYTIVTVGNPDIKPQRSEGYEFGADLFYGSNYSLSLTYYDQKIKDMIQSSYTEDVISNPPITYYYYYNIAKAINRGLELSAKAILNPFTINVSYTQTTSKWGSEIGQTPSAIVYPGAPNLGIPKRSFFAHLSYAIPSLFKWSKKGGSINLDWRYNGSAFDYDIISYSLAVNAWNQLPDPKPAYPDASKFLLWQKGYSYFNLRADYSITNYAAIYIDIQNLLDKQGSVNGISFSRFPGRRINFGFNLTF